MRLLELSSAIFETLRNMTETTLKEFRYKL